MTSIETWVFIGSLATVVRAVFDYLRYRRDK